MHDALDQILRLAVFAQNPERGAENLHRLDGRKHLEQLGENQIPQLRVGEALNGFANKDQNVSGRQFIRVCTWNRVVLCDKQEMLFRHKPRYSNIPERNSMRTGITFEA